MFKYLSFHIKNNLVNSAVFGTLLFALLESLKIWKIMRSFGCGGDVKCQFDFFDCVNKFATCHTSVDWYM